MYIQSFSLGLQIYIYILFGMLGSIFGSFITCMVDRMIHHEDWIHGSSHCDTCGHKLSLGDLIPIFSYIFHRGKCKYCGAKIPLRCLLTEIGMFLMFDGLLYVYGLSLITIRNTIFTCILLAIALYDYETYIIPDRFHVIAIGVYIIFLLLSGNIVEELKFSFFGVLVSIGILIVTLIFDKISHKEGLGGGDIKLFFVIGLYFGLAQTMLILFVSCIIGLLFVVVLKQNKIPFGPSISLATCICMLIGSGIVQWYLQLFF